MTEQRADKTENKFTSLIRSITRRENEAAMSDLKKRMTLSLVFLAAQAATHVADTGTEAKWIIEGILLVPLILVNYRCFTDAFLSVKHRRPEKNLLAALSVILAVGIMRFGTAGVILTTMAVCRYLESYIRLKLHAHLTALIDAEPSDQGIKKGDILQILPGEIIPADGVIIAGGSAVDEEIITGERIPPKKIDGDKVFAGSMNLHTEITIKVVRTGDERVISRLIDHIGSAILTRSPKSEKYERIARRFVVVVIAISLVVAVLWIMADGRMADGAITGIAIMIIANPYAFSVAIPMNVLAAVVIGARHGILLRSAEILEDTKDINTIVLNKRGTITVNEPEISDVVALDDEFDLSLAGILESKAEHPYGKIIYREAAKAWESMSEAAKKSEDLPEAEQMEYVKGRGIHCIYEGNDYYAGNASFMESLGINTDIKESDDLFHQGKSLVFFAKAKELIGIIAVRDVPRPNSLKAISQMESMGIDVVMLTSDSRQTAEAVRSEIGIDHVFADILPEDKKTIVRKIRTEKNKIVAMVSDGGYDADALEEADLGVAITTGKDIDIGPAEIVLITDDLLDVVRAMKISRASVRNLRQCVAFAYVYNILAIICAAGLFAFLTGITLMPIASAVCMCASQVLVTLNSLRLKKTIY